MLNTWKVNTAAVVVNTCGHICQTQPEELETPSVGLLVKTVTVLLVFPVVAVAPAAGVITDRWEPQW